MLSGGRVVQLEKTFMKGGERLTKINSDNVFLFKASKIMRFIIHQFLRFNGMGRTSDALRCVEPLCPERYNQVLKARH
jgi:hypothetical protein